MEWIFPMVPLLDHLPGLAHAPAVPPLRAHDHDAVVLAGGLDHPLAFVDEERHRLLDVDVLAGGAGHDGVQGMPVVRRRDDDALDVLVLVHLPEIAVALGVGTLHVRQTLVHPRLVAVAHAQQFDILELLEIRDVLLADQAESDDPDADAVVGAEHAAIGCRRHDSRARCAQRIRAGWACPLLTARRASGWQGPA